MWLEVDRFKEKVKQWWVGSQVERLAGFVFGEKLRALKGEIEKWNKEVLGNIKERERIRVLER